MNTNEGTPTKQGNTDGEMQREQQKNRQNEEICEGKTKTRTYEYKQKNGGQTRHYRSMQTERCKDRNALSTKQWNIQRGRHEDRGGKKCTSWMLGMLMSTLGVAWDAEVSVELSANTRWPEREEERLFKLAN